MNQKDVEDYVLAAQSIGRTIAFQGDDAEEVGFDFWEPLLENGRDYVFWNPLDSSDDAFTLAAQIGFKTLCDEHGQAYVWLKDELLWNEFALNEGSVDERAAALRRAIFRAAVVVGKRMK